jgi:4-carboxymuconolactone decarboxylase
MTDADNQTRFERGMAKQVEMNGKAGNTEREMVERLGDLGRYVIEFAYGDIYTRTVMTERDREIGAVAVLTVLGREKQLAAHIGTALKLGMTVNEVEEVILQTVTYAGFPTALNAIGVLRQVQTEQAE